MRISRSKDARGRPGWVSLVSSIAVLWCSVGLAGASAQGQGEARLLTPPPVPESARAETAWDGDDPRVEARLLFGARDAASGTRRIGVLLDPDPGWHIYGREPGDTGLPTVLRWKVPDAEVGPVAWPSPSVFREGDGSLVTYGYEDRVLLVSSLELTGPPAAERTARVDVELLACRHECIPGHLTLQRMLGPEVAASEAVFFDAHERPDTAATDTPGTGSAVAVTGTGAAAEPTAAGLARAILLGLLGGLLLNLMPCVLPVLAIKVCAVAELAHRSRREVVAHGMAYALGVEASMAALAAVVTGLRAAGTSVGWGFQFQEPVFLVAISAVLVLFALNLFGAFEIEIGAGRLAGIGAGAAGPRRSFFEGLLAVVLATPCTAPFLGTAVGFAFASPGPVIFAIFLAIGLGLASPYLLVTWVPAWSRVIPRSGAWMLRVRTSLGFALLGAVAWLQWVVGRAQGADAMASLLVFLLGVAFAAWVFGLLQRSQRPGRALAAGFFCIGIAAVGANTLDLEPQTRAAGATHAAGPDAPEPFDPSAVSEQLARGRAVFVYFTADWCLTCKLNESRVLSQERVLSELRQRNVAVFEADWTRRDETIRAELARFGKAGVPMYLLYRPDAPNRPVLLPELLTVEGFVGALADAAPGKLDRG